MMQRIDKQAISRDEAFKLAEKMVSKGVTGYIIRDALIERGLSAYESNEIVNQVRQVHLHDIQFEESKISSAQIALIVIAIAILLIIFFGIVNPVS